MIPFATPKLIIGIAATMAAIYSADQFLARLEHRELDAQARHEYAIGMELLRSGHDAEPSLKRAIAAFQSAHTLDREDTSFQSALADAFIRDHQPQRAIDAVSEVLGKDSNDGQANLLMARAMNEQRQYASADSFYHRAIYGTWPPNAEGPFRARVELVQWLAKRSDQKSLLSELILLEPLAAGSRSAASIARDLPYLFRQAGSPGRAIDSYRQWLRDNPRDADAYAGLGETELQSGSLHAARRAFEKASELKPDDSSLKRREDVARSALELDPTPRGVSSSEKLARSARILDLVISTVRQCAGAQADDSPSFANAQKLLTEKKPAVTNEAAEMRLGSAETIWNMRPGSCTPAPEKDELITVLMRKLAQ